MERKNEYCSPSLPEAQNSSTFYALTLSHSVFPLGSQLSKHHSFHELLAHSALVIPEHAGAARRRAALSEHSWHVGHTPPKALPTHPNALSLFNQGATAYALFAGTILVRLTLSHSMQP